MGCEAPASGVCVSGHAPPHRRVQWNATMFLFKDRAELVRAPKERRSGSVPARRNRRSTGREKHRRSDEGSREGAPERARSKGNLAEVPGRRETGRATRRVVPGPVASGVPGAGPRTSRPALGIRRCRSTAGRGSAPAGRALRRLSAPVGHRPDDVGLRLTPLPAAAGQNDTIMDEQHY